MAGSLSFVKSEPPRTDAAGHGLSMADYLGLPKTQGPECGGNGGGNGGKRSHVVVGADGELQALPDSPAFTPLEVDLDTCHGGGSENVIKGIPTFVLRYRLLPQHSQEARHEDLFRRSCDHVVDRIAIFVRRRDIEEGQLVGARLIVDTGLLHGVARIAKVDEIHTFHDTARVHI